MFFRAFFLTVVTRMPVFQTKTAPCHFHPSCHHFPHHHGSDHYQLFRSHYDDNVQEILAEAKGAAFKILAQFIAGLKTELG